MSIINPNYNESNPALTTLFSSFSNEVKTNPNYKRHFNPHLTVNKVFLTLSYILSDILPTPQRPVEMVMTDNTPNPNLLAVFPYFNSPSSINFRVIYDSKFNTKSIEDWLRTNIWGRDTQQVYLDMVKNLDRHYGWEQFLQESGRHALRIYNDNGNMLVFTNHVNPVFLFRLFSIFLNQLIKMHNLRAPELISLLTALGNEEDLEAARLMDTYNLWEANKNKNFRDLSNFFNNIDIKKIQTLNTQIHDLQNDIRSQEEYVAGLYATIAEHQRTLFSWENAPKNTMNMEILKPYLEDHPYISTVKPNADKGEITVQLYAPLRYWDDTAINVILETRKANKNQDMYLMLKALFHDETYRLWCYSTLVINYDTKKIEADSSPHHAMEAFPHPHIATIGCLGNNRALMNNAMANNDFALVFEQMVATAFNINVIDTPVWGKIIDLLDNATFTATCIEDVKTHERITVREFKERIKQDEKHRLESQNQQEAAGVAIGHVATVDFGETVQGEAVRNYTDTTDQG